MNNEITTEQKKKWIFEALIKSGFERVNEMEIFTKEHDGKRIIIADLTAGKSVVFKEGTTRISTDDEEGTLLKVSKIITDAEDGRMPTKSTPDEVVHVPKKDEPAPAPETPKKVNEDTKDIGVPPEPAPNIADKAPKQYTPTTETVELTIDIVKKYVNEKVTDEEAYRFIQLCKARHLNPFIGQVHLIKKEFTGTAKTVVGKDVFMETATRHPQYDGFEAGIIIKAKGKKTTEDRPGAFLDDDETLVGGWAKVHRKDQKYCTEARVSMKEYSTGKASWKNIPATMIRKVPLVQAQREAFAAELSGMYDSSEMGEEIE